MELTIKSEKVLEAAEKCPVAKQLLKILFPDAFKEAEVFFGKGDIFTTKYGRVILAQVNASKACLIVISGPARGSRLANPICLESGFNRVTEAHLREMLEYECDVKEVIKTRERR